MKPLSGSVPSVRASALSAPGDSADGKQPSKSRQKKFQRHFPQVGPEERVLNCEYRETSRLNCAVISMVSTLSYYIILRSYTFILHTTYFFLTFIISFSLLSNLCHISFFGFFYFYLWFFLFVFLFLSYPRYLL